MDVQLENSIYESESVKEILENLLSYNRKSPMSIRQFSKKIGYSSDRTLGMIYSGVRPLNDNVLEKLSEMFQISGKPLKYIELISEKEKAELSKDSDRLKKCTEQLETFKSSLDRYVKLTAKELRLMMEWYSFPILHFVEINGEKGVAASQIFKHFDGKVEKEEILKTLNLYKNLGRLEIHSSDLWRASVKDKFYHSTFDIPSESIRQTHKNQLQRAAEVLDQQSVHDREFLTTTLDLSEDKIKVVKQRLREFLTGLSDEVCPEGSSSSNSVYQLNLQFYRQAKGQKD